ncbi:MAG: site-specific integrase [Geobacter sp.]|nr:site-specific integrase [Geobacter sp.]
MIHVDSYLYLSRHNIYYFRVIIPKAVGESLHKREYRRSMQTRNLSVARNMARALRSCFESHVEGIQGDMIKWEQLRQLLDKRLERMLASEKEGLRQDGPYAIGMHDHWEHEVIPSYQQAIQVISSLRGQPVSETTVNRIPDFVRNLAEGILRDSGITLDNSLKLFLAFCEGTLNMYLEYYRQRLILNNQAHSFQAGQPFDLPVMSPSVSVEAVPASLLSYVIDQYCGEMVLGGNWTAKTEQEYRHIYKVLVEVINDRPINTVGYRDAQFFKKSLTCLPSNMSKKPLYRDKTIKDILMMKIPKEDLLSISKVNAYISRVSSLFNWAIKNGYTQQNPFSGQKIKESKADHEKREVFSDLDLQVLFASSSYKSGSHKHPHYYWLPLLGLYTGARINELCQLYLDDIYQIDGQWVIDINDALDKKLKTASSARIIPLHSRLIELGLVEFTKQLKRKGYSRLFPELNKGRDGYSQDASKWFARYRARCGVNGDDKTFHSFRHTALNHLKQRGAVKEKIAAIAGHKDRSITTGHYGKPYESQALIEVIEMLDFHLKCDALKSLPKWS